ncbi:hypothetical protein ABC347_00130 [Sphingomonas sp. 1P06PA]|uniref:hypothetical protein n=1 Tax=Sphingomonas sp. 1P06PA TaxID=554121 RepID=UPI0039A77068
MARLLVLLMLIWSGAAQAAPLDRIADDFVRATLEIGTHETGYVDAYYGDPKIAAAAKAAPRSLPQLTAAMRALAVRLDGIDAARLAPIEQRRRLFLQGQVKAAETRLAMRGGATLRFADEAAGLFGVRPAPTPLASYDAALARIAALVPGEGALAARVDAFSSRYAIPADRVKPVIRAAIAECRRRTVAHIALPEAETFRLELVTDKPWGGYNWYEGKATSLIQVNVGLPVKIDRAIDLGCHEGYPGHHALNMLLEAKLARGRGWREFTVYPLYSPQSLIAEGSANYGIEMAFPDEEGLAFEMATLYPLAGLDPATARPYWALRQELKALAGAQTTIAALYLDGEIDRETAIGLRQKYGLINRAEAERSVRFIDSYRSYVINYGLGRDMVRDWVEAAGADPAARWARFGRLISEPSVPADLATR